MYLFLRRAVFLIAEVVAFALMMTAPMVADHLEGSQQATGKPEHSLSGIDVYKTTIAEVIKVYGAPTSKRDIPAEGVKDGVGGERNYIWERKGLRLGAWTYYHNDRKTGVNSVDVWGTAPSEGLDRVVSGIETRKAAICTAWRSPKSYWLAR
jgi:hypothetical protein